jgi:ABC-type lipoprotein export system ATPase subunit
MSACLMAQKIRRNYGRVVALAGVSMDLARGEIVALAGPSGSGKTSLLGILGGLDQPNAGKVMLEGRDFYSLGRTERSKLRAARIGFIFQTHNLLASLTAEENIALAVQHGGARHGDPVSRAREALALLDLADVGQRRPIALSLGEQQRVAVARALAAGPPIIIADEPTASLDGVAGRTVLGALVTAAHSGCAVLLASHDDRCLAAADRVLHLLDGRLVEDGSVPARP